MQRNIQSITVEEFNELDADIFLVSPPCQPFTRVGLKGDLQDPRTQSFLHLLQTLPRLARMPSYILVENVQGFEGSNTRAQLVKILENCCYDHQEFLLSPTHFGIPNQRLRYFLVAKRRPLVFSPALISTREHQVLREQRVNSAMPHDPNCLKTESAAPKGVAVTADSESELLVDDLERVPIGYSQDDSEAKPRTSKLHVHETSLACCNEGSNPNVVTDQTEDTQSGDYMKESVAVYNYIVTGENAGHDNVHSNCICCSKAESRAGEVSVLSNCLRKDLPKGYSPSAYESSSEKFSDGGVMDEPCRCTASRSRSSTQNHEPTVCDPLSALKKPCKEGLPVSGKKVGDYLENLPEDEVKQLLLLDVLLKRFARIMDVVVATDSHTRCFTKAYGHYVEGTGSLLQMNNTTQGRPLLKNCSKEIEGITEEYLEQLRRLRIRYFTSREIANLHHFPADFDFPVELTRRQRYRCLGNSLNVHVVSVLLRYMVTECAQ
ncbi:tRNA (cytosine-5-)-methyltransferase-like isoform X2 [Acanthaster planci]|nr:tRNA (cytosine-5-)-methyltransferase-like isoform X2 [Acanthaster planci]